MTEREDNLIDVDILINEVVGKPFTSVYLDILCAKYKFTLVEATIFSIILGWNVHNKPCKYSQLKFKELLNTSTPTIRKALNSLEERGVLYRIEKKSPKGIVYEFRITGFDF